MTTDIASGIKKDTAEKIEVIINEYGKISRALLKEAGVHESLMQTVRTFAANESAMLNTAEVIRQMRNLTMELETHVNSIDSSSRLLEDRLSRLSSSPLSSLPPIVLMLLYSIKGLPKLNQLLQDTSNITKGLDMSKLETASSGQT